MSIATRLLTLSAVGKAPIVAVVSPDWCNSGPAVNEHGHRVILASLE
jgi:hypothetical protein